MSSVYTPSSVAPPASYTIPSDGDPKTAASVNVPFQSLMDGLKHVYAGNVTALTVAGTATFNGNVAFSATTDVTVAKSIAFNGETRWSRAAGGDSALFQIDESKQVWTVPTLTAARTWQLDTTSVPPTNCRTRVVRLTTDAFALTIQNETGPTTLATMPSGQKAWAEFDYDGAAWVVVAWGGATTVP